MSFFKWSLRLAVLGALGLAWLLAGIYLYLAPGLPDVETLRDVRLQTPMRVYTRDGDLIGQFGEQKRNPLTYDEIPQRFVQALLAAEDDGFFRHRGIDIGGLLRAVSELVLTGEKGSGGSTLTMQVARNYFLSLERTFMRKFNEILLAIEIERRLSKEEIFELYVNRVFLGHRAYGFEAAAQTYYGKSMADLNLAQHAMLAGIPKAPSRNNPLSGPEAGKQRRNWILGRMHGLGFIDARSLATARAAPVTASEHGARITLDAGHAAEMARHQMLQRYGLSAYNDGYSVYTTLSSSLQKTAQRSVVTGLITYDNRHGYRGPEDALPGAKGVDPAAGALPLDEWQAALADMPTLTDMQPAAVIAVDDEGAGILFEDGRRARLPFEEGLSRTRPYLSEDRRDSAPETAGELLAVGDIVRVRPDASAESDDVYELVQVPAAQAALVSLNPNDGAIISLVGGSDFALSKFNRATQAQRQPGSNMKPFLYSAALDAGFSAASIINDAPIVVEDSSLEGIWRPENDSGRFLGPTRLRSALASSRNLVSIRLLQQLGVRRFLGYVTDLAIDTSDFAPDLSLALGTQTMAPIDVAAAYAILANGGYRVEPYLIERIEDLAGNVVFEANPATVCRRCEADSEALPEEDGEEELSMEEILDAGERVIAPRVMDERVHFIIDNMLMDVIKRGTGKRALVLERSDIAGKTGTTNGPVDAWFSGYNPEVVTTTWVGFDDYGPLGRREFGGTAALPIWIEFMRAALADSEDRPRPLPAGICHARIDPQTGLLAPADGSTAIFEYFRCDNMPEESDGDSGGLRGTDELLQEIF
ncbi:MAG: penicillin-binding protein 1A [Pseudomonadota bacterium]